MPDHECPRERELLDALQASRWPAACDAQLQTHVATCGSCTDLLAVVAPLLDEQRALTREAAVPSSAIIWWRAQLRFKREAMERASQPLTFVQGVAIACAAGLLATLLGMFVPTFRRSLVWFTEASLPLPSVSLAAIENPLLANPIVIAALAALGLCALVLPVALYFAFHED